jgi:thiamine transporter ThiT
LLVVVIAIVVVVVVVLSLLPLVASEFSVSVQTLGTLVAAYRCSCWRLQGCIGRLLSVDRINMRTVTHSKGSKMTAEGEF